MTEPVRFSLTLPLYRDDRASQPYDETFRFAGHVEDLGFFTGYLGHHSFTPETGDASAPFLVLAAIAGHTDRLRLGTGIYLGALHHPVTVAEHVQGLDQISGGRAVLGVGVGYRSYEYEGFGLDFQERGGRLTELVETLATAWSTGTYMHEGRFFSIPDLPVEPPCVQQPRPPILCGGTSPAGLTRAARLGDGWISLPMENLTRMKKLVDRYRDLCADAGRKPYVCLMREAWVAPTEAQVEEEYLSRALAFHRYYWEAGTPGDDRDPVLKRVAAGDGVSYQEFAHDRAIAGTPDFCVEELHRWHDATAFDEICLMFLGATRDPAVLYRTIDLFAAEVMATFHR
jgi:probable F420-dependent oxidoreductase